MNYQVIYQSGIKFSASGKLIRSIVDGIKVVGIELDSAACVKGNYVPAGQVLLIDPRSVVTNESGNVVYNADFKGEIEKFQ